MVQRRNSSDSSQLPPRQPKRKEKNRVLQRRVRLWGCRSVARLSLLRERKRERDDYRLLSLHFYPRRQMYYVLHKERGTVVRQMGRFIRYYAYSSLLCLLFFYLTLGSLCPTRLHAKPSLSHTVLGHPLTKKKKKRQSTVNKSRLNRPLYPFYFFHRSYYNTCFSLFHSNTDISMFSLL